MLLGSRLLSVSCTQNLEYNFFGWKGWMSSGVQNSVADLDVCSCEPVGSFPLAGLTAASTEDFQKRG